MSLIYRNDIIPIIITATVFSLAATMHRVLLPNQYSAFLQFKGAEDEKKCVRSTSIRIIYLIFITIILYYMFKLSCKQISIGICIACFLNEWPVIVEYHLLRLSKPKEEWFLLLGYFCYVCGSVAVEVITLKLLMPSLFESELQWFGSPLISITLSLILLAIPIPVETLISRCTHVVMEEKLDTFLGETRIIERELNVKCLRIERNKYVIDDVAKKYNINVKLLTPILRLEIFYRDMVYYSILESIACIFLNIMQLKKIFQSV